MDLFRWEALGVVTSCFLSPQNLATWFHMFISNQFQFHLRGQGRLRGLLRTTGDAGISLGSSKKLQYVPQLWKTLLLSLFKHNSNLGSPSAVVDVVNLWKFLITSDFMINTDPIRGFLFHSGVCSPKYYIRSNNLNLHWQSHDWFWHILVECMQAEVRHSKAFGNLSTFYRLHLWTCHSNSPDLSWGRTVHREVLDWAWWTLLLLIGSSLQRSWEPSDAEWIENGTSPHENWTWNTWQ